MKLFKTRTPKALREGPRPEQGDGAEGAPLAPGENLLEMSFLDHLEELRWSILKGLGGILTATIACVFFRRWIIDVLLLGPTREDFFMYRMFGLDAQTVPLQNRTLPGQFFADWGTVLAVGLILGSPFVVYQIWRFIEPGLYPHEKKGLRFAAVFATFFFVSGICFGYLVLTPLALQFFAHYSISEQIVNYIDITNYFSMVTTWVFGVGLLFELPVIVFFLAKLGILTPAFMRTSRKYALIIILIASAFFTPPDPLSMILVAIPLLGLYEISIYVAAYVERVRERELKQALE